MLCFKNFRVCVSICNNNTFLTYAAPILFGQESNSLF